MTALLRLVARLLVLGLALLGQPAIAAGTPVKVSADTFTVDQAAGVATFTGNVVITRSGMDMWADKVIVRYGSGGAADVDMLDATGNVRIKTSGQEASGRRATFDPDTAILRLFDNVTVVNAQGTFRGPELTIDLSTNSSVFKGSEGGRVTGVFTPQ